MSKKVLIVEDDGPRRRRIVDLIKNQTTDDLDVFGVESIKDTLAHFAAHPDTDVVVIDMTLNPRAGERKSIAAEDGQKDGHALAIHLTQLKPSPKLLGLTFDVRGAADCIDFFRAVGDPSKEVGVYDKNTQLALLRHHVLHLVGQQANVKVFIVYGHDHKLRDQAKKYCEETLGWTAETLDPTNGVGWMDQFERQGNEASLAWVLATDDEWGAPRDPAAHFSAERRPRPNVILEYGYFLGRFGRRSHRVFLFCRPDVKLGSDVSDVAHIPLPAKFTDAEADIRTHHRVWLLS